MPGNAFVKFVLKGGGTAPGESQQTTHNGTEGWIEVGDWSWEVEAEASHLKGTGAAVGKPTSGALSLTHYYDKSSTLIQQFIVKGTHFQEVRLNMLKQTGDDKPQVFFELIMGHVFITKVSNSGEEDGSVKQELEMVFKEVMVGYKPQGQDGVLKAMLPFRWNIAEMTQETSSGLKFAIK